MDELIALEQEIAFLLNGPAIYGDPSQAGTKKAIFKSTAFRYFTVLEETLGLDSGSMRFTPGNHAFSGYAAYESPFLMISLQQITPVTHRVHLKFTNEEYYRYYSEQELPRVRAAIQEMTEELEFKQKTLPPAS